MLAGISLLVLLSARLHAGEISEAEKAGRALAALNAELPTLFVASDSTAAKSYIPGQMGWAEQLPQYFDPAKITIVNLARGGRSSRTFLTEGWWAQLLAHASTDDIVLIQFAHNDAGAIDAFNARGSIPGLGEETRVVLNAVTGRYEVVHTFGWYVRQMIAQAKEHGLQPVLVSPTVRKSWNDGRIARDPDGYAAWLEALAQEAGVPFVDLSRAAADALEDLGEEHVQKLYQGKTHLSEAGAALHAEIVVQGLLEADGLSLSPFLSREGQCLLTEQRK